MSPGSRSESFVVVSGTPVELYRPERQVCPGSLTLHHASERTNGHPIDGVQAGLHDPSILKDSVNALLSTSLHCYGWCHNNGEVGELMMDAGRSEIRRHGYQT